MATSLSKGVFTPTPSTRGSGRTNPLDRYCRRWIERLLTRAGIAVNGNRPWDLQLHDERMFRSVALFGNLGLGESYMRGWFDCQALDQFFDRVLRARLDRGVFHLHALLLTFQARMRNLQSLKRAFEVGRRHYDLGDDLYRAMLDSRMIYSCGYWRRAADLDQAQEHKLDLIAAKLGLEPGMKVLDIGCGWGGAARYFAEKFGVKVLGISISRHQIAWATRHNQVEGVEFRLQDYRELEGRFDAIYSIGMFEHVGPRNYRTYMQVVRRLLADDGRFLLHTIGSHAPGLSHDPWIHRYIFPNGILPNVQALAESLQGLFRVEDWHTFGPYYDLTLMAWHQRFEQAWSSLRERYDETFRRMWRYYLLSCAGAFRARDIDLWQLLLSPQEQAVEWRPCVYR